MGNLHTCSKCLLEKTTDCFTTNKKSLTGLHYYCKTCCSKYKKDKGSYSAGKRRYRDLNRDVEREKARKKRLDPSNREKLKEARRKIRKRKMADPIFRISRNLRSRLWRALKGLTKLSSAVGDLGCSQDHFLEHMASCFQEGMTWENYGIHGWEIDHILPISSFDLSKVDQQLLCNHYTNLQPLWYWQNRYKSNKVSEV